MQTREDVMALLARMSESAWAHQTLRALVESGAIAQLSEPRTASEIAAATKLPAEAAERALGGRPGPSPRPPENFRTASRVRTSRGAGRNCRKQGSEGIP